MEGEAPGASEGVAEGVRVALEVAEAGALFVGSWHREAVADTEAEVEREG